MVWIPILENDTIEAAIPSVRNINDHRIKHYYDRHKIAGRSIADSVGWNGYVAWDIYLFYAPAVRWSETPPEPVYWMHQLSADWADRDKYRTGNDLKNELSAALATLIGC